MKKKTWKRILYYALLGVFIAVFIGCAIYIGDYFVKMQQARKMNEELQNIKNSVTVPTRGPYTPPTEPSLGPGETLAPTEPPEATEPQILPEYQELYNMNNDLVGWITIPETNIDYPVLQTPKNPNYYLNRNFYKLYDARGSLYVREDCDVFAPSDNITIYGHRMEIPDGSMFYQLDKYKKKDYWENHQYFYFDTLYERHTYQIISVFKTHGETGFPYHRFHDAKDEEEFNTFINTIKSMESYYSTGLTAEYGDKLLCLSTCEYTLGNGRFVVVAKRVD